MSRRGSPTCCTSLASCPGLSVSLYPKIVTLYKLKFWFICHRTLKESLPLTPNWKMLLFTYFLLHVMRESIDDDNGIWRFLRVWRFMDVSSLWNKWKASWACRRAPCWRVPGIHFEFFPPVSPEWLAQTSLPPTHEQWHVLPVGWLKGSCVAPELSLGLEHMNNVGQGQAQISPWAKSRCFNGLAAQHFWGQQTQMASCSLLLLVIRSRATKSSWADT